MATSLSRASSSSARPPTLELPDGRSAIKWCQERTDERWQDGSHYSHLVRQGRIWRTPGPARPLCSRLFMRERGIYTWGDASPLATWDGKLRISVVSLFRENERYVEPFGEMWRAVEEAFEDRLEIRYYIYENDSTDSTARLLTEFMRGREGALETATEESPRELVQEVSVRRGTKMAELRNNWKGRHELRSDYTIILDTDVVFSPTTISKLLEAALTSPNTMVTPFCLCVTRSEDGHYYDTLALVGKDGATSKSCPFAECKRCHGKGRHTHRRGERFEVASAFGCVAILPTSLYSMSTFAPGVCEHHGFCASVRANGGKVIVASDITVAVHSDSRKADFAGIRNLLQEGIERPYESLLTEEHAPAGTFRRPPRGSRIRAFGVLPRRDRPAYLRGGLCEG